MTVTERIVHPVVPFGFFDEHSHTAVDLHQKIKVSNKNVPKEKQ